MDFYPINLNLKNKKVLIVGAGKVAYRKFKRLQKTAALIKVVSPEFDDLFAKFFKKKAKKHEFICRNFKKSDLNKIFLVFAATDNHQLNKKITNLAQSKNILVNRIDNSQESDFIVPAVINKGELLLTISTDSTLPALSKRIRKKLENEFGLEYLFLLKIMKDKRSEIIREIDEPLIRKRIFKNLAADEFLKKIKNIIITNITEEKTAEDSELKILENKIVYKKIEKEINNIIANRSKIK